MCIFIYVSLLMYLFIYIYIYIYTFTGSNIEYMYIASCSPGRPTIVANMSEGSEEAEPTSALGHQVCPG